MKEKQIIKRNPFKEISDVLIINTIDGSLHGIQKSTGNLLWTKQLTGPIIKVQDMLIVKPQQPDNSADSQLPAIVNSGVPIENEDHREPQKLTFIPEPGSGDLYYIEPGQEIKQFDKSLKDLVQNNLGLRNDKHIFTGHKHTTVIAINPLTGEVLKYYGPEGPVHCSDSTDAVVYLGRTEYTLHIWDIAKQHLLWNITMYEYGANEVLDGPKSAKPNVYATAGGKFGIKNTDTQLSTTDLGSAIVSAFDISNGKNGAQLTKLFDEVDSRNKQGYIGSIDGTLFLLSDKNYPHVEKLDGSVVDLDCPPDDLNYPNCLTGTYNFEADGAIDQIAYVENKFEIQHVIQAALLLAVTVLVTLHQYIKKRSSPITPMVSLNESLTTTIKSLKNELDKEPLLLEKLQKGEEDAVDESSTLSKSSVVSRPSTNSQSLKNISVSENVLGYGSHGTVVLKGTFEGRVVAVKRMLADFYDVADHEVKMLQESDQHPNVVRYYFKVIFSINKEQCEGFTYMALEYCAGSICDLINKVDIPEVHTLNRELSLPTMFEQIISGISHLHSLNIVHRDIKPQNILISHTHGKKKIPRILISDFGLGKRLQDGQSSFHNTIVPGGGPAGTAGWRAPECLLANKQAEDPEVGWNDSSGKPISYHTHPKPRITKAIDIFSLGCVFYYMASGGGHPFGERFTREMNILKGNHRINGVDNVKDSFLLKDLIKQMVSKEPKKRPAADNLVSHPYFWSSAQKLSFLQDVSDRLESEPRDLPSALVKSLERAASKVVGRDWHQKFNNEVIEQMVKYRKYDGGSVQDLLRAIRNMKHHYQDLPDSLKLKLGTLPDGFVAFFSERFPSLLLNTFTFVQNNSKLKKDAMFLQYFESK